MFLALSNLLRLVWRYRRLIAFVLTLIAGLMERHRQKLPQPLQRVDLARVPGVRAPASAGPPAKR